MAITLDAKETSANSSTSLTHDHTCAASATILIVSAGARDFGGGSPGLSATYNGVSMTELVTRVDSQGRFRTSIFYLINPDSGTNSVTITAGSATDEMYSGSASWFGVDTSTPFRSSDSNIGTSSTVSVDITSEANDMVVDGAACNNDTLETVGAGQTIFGQPMPRVHSASYEGATGTSTTMSWGLPSSAEWVSVGASMIPGPEPTYQPQIMMVS